jgi:A/G-specific adenine glycosylase
MNAQQKTEFSSFLLAWYDTSARVLPWRSDPTPYKVWVSEMMLQQTRVDTVIPYFMRFVAELPGVSALANVSEERLLKLWEGLGYYNRVRNMKKTAELLLSQYQGEIPHTKEELLLLPGIGPYAAGSIASIAFGVRTPAVDGNVLRVMARIEAINADLTSPANKKAIANLVQTIIPATRAGDFNQALMDLGATICLPNGKPDCVHCPVRSFCQADQLDLTASIPAAPEKTKRKSIPLTVFVIHSDTRYAIQKRVEKGLLANFWEFPNVEGHLSSAEVNEMMDTWGLQVKEITPLEPARYLFTHLEWDMRGFLVEIEEISSVPFHFVTRAEMDNDFPVPTAFRFYQKLLK